MADAQPAADTGLRRKLLWSLGLRVSTVTILLGSGILAQITAPGALPIDPFFFVIGLTYALTVIYALTLRHVERNRWLIDVQLGADALIVSAVVFMTGGVLSYFATLYVLPIVAASVLQSRRGGLLVSILSSLMYGGLVLSQYTGVSGLLAGPIVTTFAQVLPPTRVALYTVGLNLFGFLGVALLSGYLAEGLRQADAQLERASSEIADLQAFNQHVIDSMMSGLATTDSEGRLITFNRAAEVITGHAAPAVKGRRIFDVLQLPNEFARSLHDGSGGSPRHDFTYTTGDGRRVEIGLTAAPLITPSGRAGFLFAFQDVTENRKQAREGRIQQRLAAVGEMAAGIAHEIRNPLASMSGSIQILRQELPLSAEQAQLMDIVLRESERLNQTIKSFLAYARPQRFSAERLDIRRIVNDTVLLLRNSAECRAGHVIDVDGPASEVVYEADEGQIRQILWNLATNGLRAMPSGGRLSLVAAAAADDPGSVIISVRDEGLGMSSDEFDGMFQPFRGAFAKGSGLGLAIVHRIVSDYDGDIRVTSEPGHGTAINVYLPGRDRHRTRSRDWRELATFEARPRSSEPVTSAPTGDGGAG